ncbi:MAG: acetamidase/formamidase family protein [Actinomycetota bacterium]|nr:acetamidase/formamidase family protein [Actinomycetota bacterium]
MTNAVLSLQPTPEQLCYTFGGRDPLGGIRPGQFLEVGTEDCFGGLVRTVADRPSVVCQLPFVNPVTGPFYVDGAQPGDTLAIHVVSISPARDWAVSATFPHFGALTSTHTTATLQQPLEERVWLYDVDTAAGVVRYHARHGDHTVELALEPMHGTIGVAPAASEVRSTIVPDAHGGNLDTPEVRAGVTAYFGVNVPGAMFSIGDGHARQGGGEVCGVAVEAAMTTVLAVDLVKGVSTPWPRLESDTHLMSIGAARPLEDAYRIAQHDLVTWLARLSGLELLDTYQLVAQAGDAPVGNVCDPNYTFVAKLAKKYLPSPVTAYGDVHARLRQRAAHRPTTRKP